MAPAWLRHCEWTDTELHAYSAAGQRQERDTDNDEDGDGVDDEKNVATWKEFQTMASDAFRAWTDAHHRGKL